MQKVTVNQTPLYVGAVGNAFDQGYDDAKNGVSRDPQEVVSAYEDNDQFYWEGQNQWHKDNVE